MIELKSLEVLNVTDEQGMKTVGGNQYWYPRNAKRACGATTASNILTYVYKMGPRSKEEHLDFMKKVYMYFTPGIFGLWLSGFLKGIGKFAKEQEIPVSSNHTKAPSLGFIRASLEADTPVALLVLTAGGVANLYNWHWVTIIGLDEENKRVKILDNTRISWVEFGDWLERSLLRGALVSICLS